MVDRTLRRAYAGTNGNEDTISDGDGGGKGSESEQSERITNTDSGVDGNGDIGESDIDGSSGIGAVEIDPEQLGEFIASGGANGDSGEPRKRRGRKPGSKNAGRKKAEATIEPFILMAHQWAAVFLKTPELMLSSDEAKKLSEAYENFCEYHDVPVLSPKRLSEINMIAAIGLVYGPRFVAVKNRIKEENKMKRAKNAGPFVVQHGVM